MNKNCKYFTNNEILGYTIFLLLRPFFQRLTTGWQKTRTICLGSLNQFIFILVLFEFWITVFVCVLRLRNWVIVLQSLKDKLAILLGYLEKFYCELMYHPMWVTCFISIFFKCKIMLYPQDQLWCWFQQLFHVNVIVLQTSSMKTDLLIVSKKLIESLRIHHCNSKTLNFWQ